MKRAWTAKGLSAGKMRKLTRVAYNPALFPRLNSMKNGKPFPLPVRAKYDCEKCPAYCCSYPEIEVTPRDIERLAKRFGLAYGDAEERFTKHDSKEKVRLLRHQKDDHFGTVCTFFDRDKRRCTVYEARPGVCRSYPDSPTCGYYEFLKFERAHQDDPEFIALT